MSDTYEADPQDQAEVFDETNLTEDGVDLANFDEIEDVYDATTALGDASDADAEDDFDTALLDDEDLETDEDVEDSLLESLEDQDDEDDDDVRDDTAHEDRRAAIETAAPVDDAPVQFVSDVDGVTNPADEEADKYEAEGELSDAEVRALGYGASPRGDAGRTATGGESGSGQGSGDGSGKTAEDVPDESHPRQEDLLDEGIEETFPASDPVSVKRIT